MFSLASKFVKLSGIVLATLVVIYKKHLCENPLQLNSH